MRCIPPTRPSASLWLSAALLAAGLVAHAADPSSEPRRGPQRSHIQSVGEIAAADPNKQNDALGLRLCRASTVLRQQLALTRGAGLVVENVADGSRAARAGFKQHDVLVMLDDQLLLLPEQLAALVEAAPADTPMECTVLRGGRQVKLSLGTAAQTGTATAAPPVGLRATESALAIVREAGGVPRPSAAPERLTRISAETLQRQDADYQLQLTGGTETRLVVTDPRGHVVFDDTIDTPEGRSRVPVGVRQRVAEMERALERRPAKPAAKIGRLDVQPIEVR